MEKIRCNSNPADFLAVSVFAGCAYVDAQQGDESAEIELSPDKIRELRKQLKRALIEIEGEKKEDDWFSVGRTVKIIANTSNHYFPIGVNVKLTKEEYPGGMRAEYLDGHDYWLVHKNDCEPAA